MSSVVFFLLSFIEREKSRVCCVHSKTGSLKPLKLKEGWLSFFRAWVYKLAAFNSSGNDFIALCLFTHTHTQSSGGEIEKRDRNIDQWTDWKTDIFKFKLKILSIPSMFIRKKKKQMLLWDGRESRKDLHRLKSNEMIRKCDVNVNFFLRTSQKFSNCYNEKNDKNHVAYVSGQIQAKI